MNGCNLNNFENIRLETRCITEVEQFFKVIGHVACANDHEFSRNIVDVSFFIYTQNRIYNIDVHGMTEKQ